MYMSIMIYIKLWWQWTEPGENVLTLPIRSTSRSDGDPYNSNHMKESRGLKLSTTKRRLERKRERNKRGKTNYIWHHMNTTFCR